MRAVYKPILPLESNSFKACINMKNEFDPFHYHHEFEINYILTGCGTRQVGTSFDHFEENDLLMMAPHLPHCWKSTAYDSSPVSTLVIQWREDLFGAGWLERKEFASIKRLHLLAAGGIKFPKQAAIRLKEKLLSVIHKPAFEKIVVLLTILKELSLVEDCELLCRDNVVKNDTSGDEERIGKIYEYLQKHYREKITLSDMASLVCLTDESFSRFFSKTMKQTFFAFLNEYRINICCKLLMETDMPILQACYQSGYESTSFFFRQFKRIKKCSPGFYRNRSKGLVEV